MTEVVLGSIHTFSLDGKEMDGLFFVAADIPVIPIPLIFSSTATTWVMSVALSVLHFFCFIIDIISLLTWWFIGN